MIEKLLTLVEESSLLMVLPREIVYHCFPVFNDIIAVLLNIAATYLFTKVLIMNAWLVEVKFHFQLKKLRFITTLLDLTFISRSDGIAIARALATSDKVRIQFSTFTL